MVETQLIYPIWNSTCAKWLTSIRSSQGVVFFEIIRATSQVSTWKFLMGVTRLEVGNTIGKWWPILGEYLLKRRNEMLMPSTNSSTTFFLHEQQSWIDFPLVTLLNWWVVVMFPTLDSTLDVEIPLLQTEPEIKTDEHIPLTE